MRKFLVALLVALAALSLSASPALAQGNTAVGIGNSAAAVAGSHSGQARPIFHNMVTWEFRHCQNYLKQTGHLFWKKTIVDVEACNADPSTLFNRQEKHNLIPTAGLLYIQQQISGTPSTACAYIAVTNTAITPAAGDTTLSGEIATNGLSRAVGTFTSTGNLTFTVAKTFTASGTQASQATGLFNAASTGTLCAEATYSAVTVNNNDTLTVTWTWTLSQS